jgi:hypothetical protein
MIDYDQIKRYMEMDVVEVLPLAYMRGRTLNESFIILDEAQNTTVSQMKMFLTRMGEGSKIVASGDVTQTDLPHHASSGLKDALRRLRHIQGVDVVRLTKADIVRHRLVQDIVRAYDREPKTKGAEARRTGSTRSSTPIMSSGSSVKTRSDRAASLKLPPGRLAQIWHLTWRRQVLARVGLCALMIVLLLLVTHSGAPPFAYRSGHIPDHDILARTSFSVANERGESQQVQERYRLVRGGRPLSTGDIQKLYAEYLALCAEEGVDECWPGSAASFGIYVLLVVICAWYLHIHHRRLLADTGRLGVLAAAVVIVVALSRLASADAWRAETIPLILFGLTIAVAFDRPWPCCSGLRSAWWCLCRRGTACRIICCWRLRLSSRR